MAFDNHVDGKIKSQEALKRVVGNIGSGRADVSSALVRALINARLPGGIVRGQDLNNEMEQELVSQLTIEGFLDNIVLTNPGYRWVIDDGVINLIPAFNEPALLNFRIAEFNADNLVSLDDALNKLLIKPEIQERIAELNLNTGLEILVGGVRPPGYHKDEKPFSVQCQNKTLREILNIIVRSQGHGIWEYKETHWNKHHGFSIKFLVQ
jgi:hypothetical protein